MSIPLGLKKVATLIILRNHDQFLLLKRSKEPNKDLYTPVGGKLDPFESPYDAAKRETKEETGIELISLSFCGILTETSPNKYNWINYVYVADIDKIEPPICNEGSLKWISFQRMENIPAPKTDQYIYQYVMDKKPFVFHANYDESLQLLSMQEEWENKFLLLR